MRVGERRLRPGRPMQVTPCLRMRRSRGWSVNRLSGLAGVSPGVIHRIENGRVAGVTVGTLVRVARPLGCSVLDLVPGLAARVGQSVPAVREGRAVGGQEASRRRRGECCAWLREYLGERGGREVAARVVEAFAERFGLSAAYLRARRVELGVVVRVRQGRFGGGLENYVWELPAGSSDS